MLLAMDIGNSSISVGVFDGDGRLVTESRLKATGGKSADEYAVLLCGIFQLKGVDRAEIDACIVSSVVPWVTPVICEAAEFLTGVRPRLVGPGVKTGLNIRIDAQTELGADLVADAVAALSDCRPPMVIVNMGSATTFTVIDRTGTLQGVIIAPGVRLSMDALARCASELPDASLTPPKGLVGKNTRDSMRSGVLIGHAAMVDGMLQRIARETGEEELKTVVTGGQASAVLPYCETEYLHRPHLTLEGLYRIAVKNRK